MNKPVLARLVGRWLYTKNNTMWMAVKVSKVKDGVAHTVWLAREPAFRATVWHCPRDEWDEVANYLAEFVPEDQWRSK